MTRRIYQVLLCFPKTVIAVTLGVTLFFGSQASKVELNNSIEAILPQGHPALLQDQEVKHVFNSREMILIGLLHDEGIFNTATLQKVQDLTRAIWQVTLATNAGSTRGASGWALPISNRSQPSWRKGLPPPTGAP